MTKIAIIIVDYHGERDTRELLASLDNVHCDNFQKEIILVNNSPQSSHFDDLNHRSGIAIIINNKNLGFVAACNQGIKLAFANSADYVCLLNNDTTVPPDFLVNLLNVFQKDKDCGIISPKIYFSAGQEFHKARYNKEEQGKVIWYAGGKIDWDNIYCSHRGVDEVDTNKYDNYQATDFATGCCMLIKKEVIKKIGFFSEEYFAYWEDVDFCVRAKKAGYKIFYQPQAVIWHKNASSSGGAGSKLHFFLQERNRIYFGLRYANLKVKVHLSIKALKYLFSSNYKICLSLIKMFI